MSMSPEQENFDNLRRLLALKRYEQPPPGYFDRLPRRIIARIEAGETGGAVTFFERICWESPWLQRILTHLEAKPAIGAAFAAAMCVFLISGLIMSEKRPDALPVLTVTGSQQPANQATLAIAADGSGPALFAKPIQTSVSSTGGMATFEAGSIFDAAGQPKAQVLKYAVPHN
jgi:hypothetical protein